MQAQGRCAVIALALVVSAGVVAAQPRPMSAPARAAQQPAPVQEPVPAPPPTDALGRDNPRGAVLGYLNAARGSDYTLAAQYLDTRLSRQAAERLAQQLFVVLDARLPARLTQLSDSPEGSRANMLQPDRELVGTIRDGTRTLDIHVDRLTRGGSPPVWLFAADTLAAVPDLYEQVTAAQRETAVPRFLTATGFGGLRLLDWIVLLVGLPLFFYSTAMLNRLLVTALRPLTRLGGLDPTRLRSVMPVPARLLLLVLLGRWILSALPLSLVVRQAWTDYASLITIVAVVWLLMILNSEAEEQIRRRIPSTNQSAASSLLRVGRRIVDVVLVTGGFLALLSHYGVNPTPALAGLGVGGIAVALAAQKTLENVIAGASLVFDQAVRVGDFLRMGTIEGTVDHIGLRSTRIRTLDRTIVSVPNGQIANASLETLSARDKFWFHPEVRLRYDTTPSQLNAVLEGIRQLLEEHSAVDRASIRVRFIRLGAFSFDVEVFAYLTARDWNHFLELQEALLFGVTDAVERAGSGLALPFQAMHVTGGDRAHAVLPSVPAGVS
jgi:MscS family membrane protein